MLRMLRIAGIVVFAVLVGFAANSLYGQYESGVLFETYNSQRKSVITMLTVSLAALIVLSIFEVRRLAVGARKPRYGQHRYAGSLSEEPAPVANADIYASRSMADEWSARKRSSGRRASRSRSYGTQPAPGLHDIWMRLLKIVCPVLPFAYIALFSLLVIKGVGLETGRWIYSLACVVMVTVSGLTAIGVYLKKTWGLSLGYLLAILNLVIFPVGTAIGLLLLIGFVGAAESFSEASRISRKRMRSFV